MRVFHVKPSLKTLCFKGFFVFLMMAVPVSCVTPLHTVEIEDYVLLENGKEILGREKGLTAFVFESDQKKVPFRQFIFEKFRLGSIQDISFYTMIDGKRFKIHVYENSEIDKYFDMSQFMVKNFETEANKRSSANFIAMSVTDDYNEDCLDEKSLFQNIVIKYLRELKIEYYNS